MEIYHQLGHNPVWNFDSLRLDNTGEGVILGPSRMPRPKVEGVETALKRTAIFDLQFFAPEITRGRLDSYDFFPNVATDGFDTDGFQNHYSEACATACVQFQIANDFRYIVIPARYSPGMRTDFINGQETIFVAPFLNAIAASGSQKPVLLQMVLNDNMIKDTQYASTLLNWATGIQQVSGVYLITQCEPRQKQIQDADFLYYMLRFVAALVESGLEVVLGYLNVESILLSIASPHIVTMGAYENMRMFNIGTYQEAPERSGPPRPRLYSSGLLQNVDLTYLGPLQRRLGDAIFDDSPYFHELTTLMRNAGNARHPNVTFQRPEIYKHFFVVLCRQLRDLATVDGVDRYRMICGMIETAIANYGRINGIVVLDSGSDGNHLRPWLTAANEFASASGWI